MSVYNLYKNVKSLVNNFDINDWHEIVTKLKVKKFKKKEVLTPKYIDFRNHFVYVNEGCLATYILDENSQMKVIDFSFADSWAGDVFSISNNVDVEMQIITIDITELMIINKEDHLYLFQNNPTYNAYYIAGLELIINKLNKRVAEFVGLPVLERYKKFIDRFAFHDIVPQQMIASYLGTTPETLSRIKKQLEESQHKMN